MSQLIYPWDSVVLIEITAIISLIHTVHEGDSILIVVLGTISNPGILSLLGSWMLISLKEAGRAEVKGTNISVNISNTISEPRFANDLCQHSGMSIY